MTNAEAIKTLHELWRETNDSWYEEVYGKAIKALEAQDSKTRRICDTCKHNSTSNKKWPCVDCDMREPADRWEPKEAKKLDAISRQAAIDILDAYQVMVENGEENPYAWARLRMSELPPAQTETDVLAWMLAYHTKSFELHGRYFPHEVIGWLVNDFSKDFIAERQKE